MNLRYYFRIYANSEFYILGIPVQLVFDHKGEHSLRAFVWAHVAGLEGKRYGIQDLMNICLGLLYYESPHVYFRNENIL